ncbi:hypothetical protein B0H19DRAFT_1273468 [Mycena capillaripes]|nr:hypothetical protein B0H19DRAFT_1273468 [Mycena capillaripes]
MSSDLASDSELDFIQHYAPPIRRDGFIYHGNDFYVQGSGYRMRRADATRLHSLLTYTAPPPLLTKAGKVAKRQPRPHEDESEEFYTSQLAHYGLQPATTKEAAKRALLTAFGTKKTLEVPSRILKLEKEMYKEYKESNKMAKAKYLEEQKEERKKEEEKRNKRKRERDSAIDSFLQDGSSRPLKKGKTQAEKDNTRDMMWLKLCPSSTNARLWGEFNFGVVSGIIRSTTIPTRVGDSAAFFWRGREDGTGESSFGEDNVGTILFLGGGKFKATMDWDIGNFEFAGTKLEGAKGKLSPQSLREWKATWRSINQSAYDRENQARWGKWGGDEDDAEQPAGSDTTEGAGSDVEVEDGYDSENCAL